MAANVASHNASFRTLRSWKAGGLVCQRLILANEYGIGKGEFYLVA